MYNTGNGPSHGLSRQAKSIWNRGHLVRGHFLEGFWTEGIWSKGIFRRAFGLRAFFWRATGTASFILVEAYSVEIKKINL